MTIKQKTDATLYLCTHYSNGHPSFVFDHFHNVLVDNRFCQWIKVKIYFFIFSMHDFVQQFQLDLRFTYQFLGNVLVFRFVQWLCDTWLVVNFDKILQLWKRVFCVFFVKRFETFSDRLVRKIKCKFSPYSMILGLSLIEKFLPFFTVTNQFIRKLDFSLFDFPQVYKRPQTWVSKTDRNEDQLNEIRRHNLLFFGFVDFEWS